MNLLLVLLLATAALSKRAWWCSVCTGGLCNTGLHRVLSLQMPV